jgi:Ferredoxin
VTVQVPLLADRPRTLLSVAKQHRVPVLFNCETGDCAACVVRVTPLTADTAAVAPTDGEVFLLKAIERTEPTPTSEDRASIGGVPRLACQYVVGRGAVRVTFNHSLKGC